MSDITRWNGYVAMSAPKPMSFAQVWETPRYIDPGVLVIHTVVFQMVIHDC